MTGTERGGFTLGLMRMTVLAVLLAGLSGTAMASLDASLAIAAATVNVGQGVVVSLTVTNTGGGDALNIVPQLSVAGPAVFTAPTPLSTTQLGAADQVTYQWTVSPTAGGTISVVAYATAAGPDTSPVVTGSVVVPPPALDARLNAAKITITAGQSVQIVLTVTNTGGSAASNVKAVAWSNSINGTNPQPVALATLAQGAKTTFTWTVTSTAAQAGGTLLLTASAGGDLISPSLMTSATITVQSPAIITAKLAATSVTVTGGSVMVVLTASNSGGATANILLTSTAFKTSGSGTLATSYVGPTPAQPIACASGATVTLTWTVTAATAGTGLTISNTVYLTDANGGPALANLWVKSGSVTVVAVGKLASRLDVMRTSDLVGQPVQFTLSVTNTGGTTVSNLTAVLTTDGVASIGASTPAAVATLAPGARTTFVWVVTPADSRLLNFTANVSGMTVTVTGSFTVFALPALAVLPGIPAPDEKVSFVFPSPARDKANIGYAMESAGTVTIRIYNAAGRLVATEEESKPAGAQSTAVTATSLAPGVYFYFVERKYGSGSSDKIGPVKFAVAR